MWRFIVILIFVSQYDLTGTFDFQSCQRLLNSATGLTIFLIEDNKKSSTSGLELVSENSPHSCTLTMSHLMTSLFPFWPTFNLNPNQYIQPTAHRCQNTLFLDVILKIIFLAGYFLLKIRHFFQYSVNTHIAINILLYIMILEHSSHKILYKKGSPLQWWAWIFEY